MICFGMFGSPFRAKDSHWKQRKSGKNFCEVRVLLRCWEVLAPWYLDGAVFFQNEEVHTHLRIVKQWPPMLDYETCWCFFLGGYRLWKFSRQGCGIVCKLNDLDPQHAQRKWRSLPSLEDLRGGLEGQSNFEMLSNVSIARVFPYYHYSLNHSWEAFGPVSWKLESSSEFYFRNHIAEIVKLQSTKQHNLWYSLMLSESLLFSSARVLAKKSNFRLNPIQLHFIARCISILSSVLYCPWNAPCVSWEEASFILDSLYIQWTGEDGLGAWGTERQQNEGKIQGCTQEQGQQKQSVAGRQLWATHVANMNYLVDDLGFRAI